MQRETFTCIPSPDSYQPTRLNLNPPTANRQPPQPPTVRPKSVRALLKKFGFRLHEQVDAKGLAARYLPHLMPWRANP